MPAYLHPCSGHAVGDGRYRAVRGELWFTIARCGWRAVHVWVRSASPPHVCRHVCRHVYRHVYKHLYMHARGMWHTLSERSCQGGHFEYRHVRTCAVDMPSAMADIEPYAARSGSPSRGVDGALSTSESAPSRATLRSLTPHNVRATLCSRQSPAMAI